MSGERRFLSSRGVLGLLTIAMVASLAGCGSSSTPVRPPSSSAEDQLLTATEIRKQPAGSVERSFLSYWSDLQYRSWAEAAAYYDPRFRAFVGTADVIAAKKLNSSLYALVKPEIARVDTKGGDATIYYALTLPEGIRELDSITWHKDGGAWQIIYDSRLDAELGQLKTNEVEIKKSGTLPTGATPASPEAIRAGKQAEQKQARFLQEELKTTSP